MRRTTTILLLFAALTAHAAHVQWDFIDFTSNPQAVRQVFITPTYLPGPVTNGWIVGDKRVFATDTNGTLVVSNVQAGTYRVQFQGPFTLTTITNNVPATNALVNSRDLGWSTLVVPGATAQYILDQQVANIKLRAGTNATVYLDGGTNVVNAEVARSDVVGATNGMTSLTRTNPAAVVFTNMIQGITNGLAGTNYVNTATNTLTPTNWLFASTNAMATTNYVRASTNGFADTNFVFGATNGLAGTNFSKAVTNGTTTLVYTNPAAVVYTNMLPGLTNGSANTNGLAGTNYVNTATNSLASTNFVHAVTNGLAGTNYVNTATNGLAGTNYVNVATNGLARTNYVNAATNGLANTNFVNSSVAASTNSLVKTNDARVVYLSNPVNVFAGRTTNGVNLGDAFSSPGGGVGSEQFGFNASAETNLASAFGNTALATGIASTAFGANSLANTYQASAFGSGASAGGTNSIAIGQTSAVSANDAIVIGGASTAFGTNSILIGSGLTSTTANVVQFGSSNQWVLFPGNGTIAGTWTNGQTVLTNLFVDRAQFLAWSTNNVVVSGAGTARANGTYIYGSGGYYTNQQNSTWTLNFQSPTWFITSQSGNAYSASSPASQTWTTLGGGANPSPTSSFAGHITLPGFDIFGVWVSTNLTYQISNAVLQASNSLFAVVATKQFGSGILTNLSASLPAFVTNGVASTNGIALYTNGSGQLVISNSIVDSGGIGIGAILTNVTLKTSPSVYATNFFVGSSISFTGSATSVKLTNDNGSASFLGSLSGSVVVSPAGAVTASGSITGLQVVADGSLLTGLRAAQITNAVSNAVTATFTTTSPLTNRAYGSNVLGAVPWATNATYATNAGIATTATNASVATNLVAGGSQTNQSLFANPVVQATNLLSGNQTNTAYSTNIVAVNGSAVDALNGTYTWDGARYTNLATGSILTNNGTVWQLYLVSFATVQYSSATLENPSWTPQTGTGATTATTVGFYRYNNGVVDVGKASGTLAIELSSKLTNYDSRPLALTNLVLMGPATNVNGAAALFDGDATTPADASNIAYTVFIEQLSLTQPTNTFTVFANHQAVLASANVATNVTDATSWDYGLVKLDPDADYTTNAVDFWFVLPASADVSHTNIWMDVATARSGTSATVLGIDFDNGDAPGLSTSAGFTAGSLQFVTNSFTSIGTGLRPQTFTVDLSPWVGLTHSLSKGELRRLRIYRNGASAADANTTPSYIVSVTFRYKDMP